MATDIIGRTIALSEIIRLFGDREFTRRDYVEKIEKLNYHAVGFDAISEYLKVNRVETFETEVELGWRERGEVVMFTKNGQPTVNEETWLRLSKREKENLERLNGNKPLERGEMDTKFVECKRYHYILDRDLVSRYFSNYYGGKISDFKSALDTLKGWI